MSSESWPWIKSKGNGVRDEAGGMVRNKEYGVPKNTVRLLQGFGICNWKPSQKEMDQGVWGLSWNWTEGKSGVK